jgi:beta-lactamase superfamily II metal-dependent hydrolase
MESHTWRRDDGNFSDGPEAGMKRANPGADTGMPDAKRLKENQTVDDYLTEQGAGERAIFERLRIVSQQRKDHELWTYFKRDDKTSLEGFQQLPLITYVGLSAKLVAFEAQKRAANDIAQANTANPLQPFIPGVAQAGNLVIMFMNIGSGDCIFIQTPKGKTIVLDCGQRATPVGRKHYQKEIRDMLLSKLYLNGQKRLYALILTHPDLDHYKEVVQIIGRTKISIRHLFFTMPKGEYAASKTFQTLDKAKIINRVAINDNGVTIRNNLNDSVAGYYELGTYHLQILGDQPDTMNGWDEDNCTIHLLAAEVPAIHNETQANAASIVTLIQAYGRKILLCGDSTLSTEDFVVRRHAALLTDVDLAQMEHHGSGTEHAGLEYVGKINPIIAVASSGPHEGDKNPRWSTIKRYADPAEAAAERTGNHRLASALDDHEIKYSRNEAWTRKDSNDWKNTYPKYGIFTTDSNGDLCFQIDQHGNMIREFTKDKKRYTYTIATDGSVTEAEQDIAGGTA